MEEKLEQSASLSSSAQKIQEAMKQLGFEYRVVELPSTTECCRRGNHRIQGRTNCSRSSSAVRTAVLVIASGVNR
jgi:hypothetical protein